MGTVRLIKFEEIEDNKALVWIEIKGDSGASMAVPVRVHRFETLAEIERAAYRSLSTLVSEGAVLLQQRLG